MKQKDLAIIIVIAFVSGMLSLLVSNKIFVTPDKRQQAVEVVDAISKEFPKADTQYFNKESFNPITNTEIKKNDNQNPFSGTN